MTGRYVVLVPLQDLPGTGVADALQTRADTLRARAASGQASPEEAEALRAMLVDSEEDAAAVLQNEIRINQLNVPKPLESWGLGEIDLVLRRSTVGELVRMAEKLYQGELLGQEATRILLELLETYTPNDDTRLGAIRKHLPAGYHFYNKRGTITDGMMVVGDLAIISLPTHAGDRVYGLGIFGYQSAPPTTYEKLHAAVAEVAHAFWNYTQTNGESFGVWS